ncbi:MAG: FAD-dependent thymidylate synthase, partial [Clostridia bacterium]|nr:FAD-dependent thymidylate synthase [Clostridia bacterium]
MLKVKLLAHTPDAEKLVAAAARFCYSHADTETIMDGLTEEKTADFLQMLMDLGHESPVEHATFTFAIEGVSRSLLAQITRHRIASFSVQSQRYVAENQFTYVTPPEIENDPEAKAFFVKTMDEIQQSYNKLSDILYAKHLEALGGPDVAGNKTKARKMANEDARFVLPNACETKIMMTMNVRSLYNFFKLRCCNRAQWEIRELAWQMLMLCKQEAPILFKNAGPACLKGPCPEGKMTCGKMAEVRERG